MSSKITYLIPAYAPSQAPSASESAQFLEPKPVENLSPIRWDFVHARPIYESGLHTGATHTRNVYISSIIPNASRWVAKLETHELRNRKGTFFPHADEVAYKIAKLFGWNTVPKTKILHQFSLEKPNAKDQKYYSLMRYFIDKNGTGGHPITFTFQAFVNGKTLPSYYEITDAVKKKPDILLSSYQRAFLLDMILGKGDARGDNTMYNPETGEIFEVDNEYLGSIDYEGILDAFMVPAHAEIEKGILKELFSVSLDQLAVIQTKYLKRNADLLSLQAREPFSLVIPTKTEGIVRNKWDAILDNLCCIQAAIHSLSEKGRPVTLAQVKKASTLKHEELKKMRRAKQLEQRKKEMIEAEKRLAQEKELRRMAPPKLSDNILNDVHFWITMGHCVVLHNQNANAHIYYYGEETNVENLRVISLDIAPSTGLLEEGKLPLSLEMVGISITDKEFQQQVTDPNKHPREAFYLQFGYKV